jgi:hypothetical protein
VAAFLRSDGGRLGVRDRFALPARLALLLRSCAATADGLACATGLRSRHFVPSWPLASAAGVLFQRAHPFVINSVLWLPGRPRPAVDQPTLRPRSGHSVRIVRHRLDL